MADNVVLQLLSATRLDMILLRYFLYKKGRGLNMKCRPRDFRRHVEQVALLFASVLHTTVSRETWHDEVGVFSTQISSRKTVTILAFS